MSEKELSPEERLAQQHTEIYSTIRDHFVSLRRLLAVAIESIDASIKVLDINPDIVKNDDET